MSKNKWSHLNDFRPDDSGKYVYQGDILHYSSGARRALFPLWAGMVSSFALVLWCGFLPDTLIGSHIAAIAGYVAAIIASCVSVYKLFELTLRGDDVPSYIYTKTLRKLPGLYMTATVALAESIAASSILIIMGDQGIDIQNEAATIALRSIAAAINVFLFLRSRSIHLSE